YSFHNLLVFFFQAYDGIRYRNVTGVQTCALPIFYSQSREITLQRNDKIQENIMRKKIVSIAAARALALGVVAPVPAMAAPAKAASSNITRQSAGVMANSSVPQESLSPLIARATFAVFFSSAALAELGIIISLAYRSTTVASTIKSWAQPGFVVS